MVWIRMVPTCSCVSKFGLQTVWERVGDTALFKGVCHWVWVLGFEKPRPFSLVLPLPCTCGSSVSSQLLSSCNPCLLPTMMAMDFTTLWKCKPSIKCFALVMVTLHNRREVTKAIRTEMLTTWEGSKYPWHLRNALHMVKNHLQQE